MILHDLQKYLKSHINDQALLFHHLSHFNWTPLFHMSTCEEMVNFFYSTILQLLDFYTPITRKSTNNLDKPGSRLNSDIW